MTPRPSKKSGEDDKNGRGTRSTTSRSKKTGRRPSRSAGGGIPSRKKTTRKQSPPPPEFEGLPMDVEDMDEVPVAPSSQMPVLHLSEMHKMTMAELQLMARDEGLEEIAGMKKHARKESGLPGRSASPAVSDRERAPSLEPSRHSAPTGSTQINWLTRFWMILQ